MLPSSQGYNLLTICLITEMLLIAANFGAFAASAYILPKDNNDRPPIIPGRELSPQGGHLLVMDKHGQPIPVLPGLLDDTLLLRGSFSFDARKVRFDKLKVLGNIYVRRINGRLLRDAYLLKGQINKKRSQDTDGIQKRGGIAEPDELKLEILK